MSATAELVFPRSYTTHGKTFLKGVEVPIDFEFAARLKGDKRFIIGGLNTAEAVKHSALLTRPQGDSLMAAIRDAADALDVDEESNFTPSGKPSHLALSEALGFPVTVEERDRACNVGKRTATVGQLDTAEGRTEKVEAPARKTPVIKTKAEAVDPSTQGAITT